MSETSLNLIPTKRELGRRALRLGVRALAPLLQVGYIAAAVALVARTPVRPGPLEPVWVLTIWGAVACAAGLLTRYLDSH